jgi:16S rRNA (adenine1518-N6/adenine1519-N6)-dimethyltransferase
MARQRLGQHFLADLDWREQIARAIRVSAQSLAPSARDKSYHWPHCWIEIGAGHGEMTEHLVATGAPVHAIELDAALARTLQQLTQQFPNLTVVQGDVLQADISAIAAGRRVRVYGNLPYYITSPILHHLFEYAELIDEMHIVIQTEVAERLTAQPKSKSYGYLSVVTQLYARPELVLRIPREAFRPPPEVGSALVTLRFPGEGAKLRLPDEAQFLEFVKLCFAQKRKTLVNNLRVISPPDRTRNALERLGLRLDARAEQLSLTVLASLHREFPSERKKQTEEM